MSQDPIFLNIFGVPWDELPPVMQKHYAIRPCSRDRVRVTGFMTIERSRLSRLLSPFLAIFGALVPLDGRDIPAAVAFYSGPEVKAFHLERTLQGPGGSVFRFHSRLEQVPGGDVVEIMRFGIGWRCRFSIVGDRVALRHVGYIWRVGPWLVPLPLAWILGRGTAGEQTLSDTRFSMWMTIDHPVFGRTYRYEGVFDIAEVTLA